MQVETGENQAVRKAILLFIVIQLEWLQDSFRDVVLCTSHYVFPSLKRNINLQDKKWYQNSPSWSYSTYPGNSSVGFLICFCFKRWLSYKEFIAQNPQAPNIHLLIMCSSLNHFRRQVVKCPTESWSPEGKHRVQCIIYPLWQLRSVLTASISIWIQVLLSVSQCNLPQINSVSLEFHQSLF